MSSTEPTTSTQPRDRRGRPLRDLRISVTDRCNMRCRYCMPREVFGPDHAFLPRADLLTFEEIERVARRAVAAGVDKIRLTGGEPLLRRGLEDLVELLAAIPGVEDLAMTTNGVLLPGRASALAAAGLTRVTVSLDAMEDAVHRAVSDTDIPVASVLAGIDAALDAGLGPVKVNAVVRRGVNDDQVLPLARFGRERGVTIRFIEFMDVGTSNAWNRDEVLPSNELLARIDAVHPLEAAPARRPGEVATRFTYTDGAGEIGVISSVSAPFCGDCTRLRLSAAGELFTCLFATRGTDVRALLRDTDTAELDASLDRLLGGVWRARADNYSEQRGRVVAEDRTADDGPDDQRVEMSYIGG